MVIAKEPSYGFPMGLLKIAFGSVSAWLAVGLAACGSSKPPMCDRAGISDGLEALVMADGEHKQMLAAAMVAEACQLPEPVRKGLADIAQSGQCIAAARGIAAAPELLVAACAGGHRAVGAIAESSEPNTALVDKCQLERLGFASRTELVRGGHWACKLLGAMTFVALRDAGEPSAKAIGRALTVE